jgi:hypothetical protein
MPLSQPLEWDMTKLENPVTRPARIAHAKKIDLECAFALSMKNGWAYMPLHSHAHVPLALVT